MLDTILGHLIAFIEHVITAMGPLGISLLMAIESCNIPLPSEAILPLRAIWFPKAYLTSM